MQKKHSTIRKPISEFTAAPHLIIDGCEQVAAFVRREDAKEFIRCIGNERMKIISVKHAETR